MNEILTHRFVKPLAIALAAPILGMTMVVYLGALFTVQILEPFILKAVQWSRLEDGKILK